MSWERADHDLILDAVNDASRKGERLSVALAVLDLRRRAWRALEGIDRRPTAAELAKAWGWSKSTVADLVADHDRWVDPRHRAAWDAFIGGRHGPGRPGLAWSSDEGRDVWCSALTMHGALEAARALVVDAERRLAEASSDARRTHAGRESDGNRSRNAGGTSDTVGVSDDVRTDLGRTSDANRHTRVNSGFTEHGSRSTEGESKRAPAQQAGTDEDTTTPEAEAVQRLVTTWQAHDETFPICDSKPLYGLLLHAPGETLDQREAVVVRVLDFIANAPDGREHAWGDAPSFIRKQGAGALRIALDLQRKRERFESLLSWSAAWAKAGRPSRHNSSRSGRSDFPQDPAAAAWADMEPRLVRTDKGGRNLHNPGGILLAGEYGDEHHRRRLAWKALGGVNAWGRADSDFASASLRRRWLTAYAALAVLPANVEAA